MKYIIKQIRKEIKELSGSIKQEVKTEMTRLESTINEIANDISAQTNMVKGATEQEEDLIISEAYQEAEKAVRKEFIKQING